DRLAVRPHQGELRRSLLATTCVPLPPATAPLLPRPRRARHTRSTAELARLGRDALPLSLAPLALLDRRHQLRGRHPAARRPRRLDQLAVHRLLARPQRGAVA